MKRRCNEAVRRSRVEVITVELIVGALMAMMDEDDAPRDAVLDEALAARCASL